MSMSSEDISECFGAMFIARADADSGAIFAVVGFAIEGSLAVVECGLGPNLGVAMDGGGLVTDEPKTSQ